MCLEINIKKFNIIFALFITLVFNTLTHKLNIFS